MIIILVESKNFQGENLEEPIFFIISVMLGLMSLLSTLSPKF